MSGLYCSPAPAALPRMLLDLSGCGDLNLFCCAPLPWRSLLQLRVPELQEVRAQPQAGPSRASRHVTLIIVAPKPYLIIPTLMVHRAPEVSQQHIRSGAPALLGSV